MKKKLILILVIGLVIGIPISKKYLSSDYVKKVSVEALQTQTVTASILASGQLTHEQAVNLSAEVIGKVSTLFVKEGDKVTKGQLVLQIDDESYLAAVEQQKAVVSHQKVAIERQALVAKNEQQKWQRRSRLFKKDLLGKDEYDAATHAYELAKIDLKSAHEQLKQYEARLEQANDQLSKTKVISPINGNITSLDIKEGETAISGTTNIRGSSLMTIANPDSMLAEINIDEADIANVALGQNAEIIAIAFADNPITGTVESIASSAKLTPGRQSLSFIVKLLLSKNQPINLRPGMSCRAEVFTQGNQTLMAVPINSIRTEEDNDQKIVINYLFIAKEGKAVKKPIKTGISDDTYQEIKEGALAGELVITGPDNILRHLKHGDPIEFDIRKDND